MTNFMNPHIGVRGTSPMQSNMAPIQPNMPMSAPQGMVYVNTPQGMMLVPQGMPNMTMQPGMQPGMMPMNMQPGMMYPNMQPGTMYPNMPMQPGMQPGMMPMNTQPGMMYPNMPMQPGMQPGMMSMNQRIPSNQGITSERFGSSSGNLNDNESTGGNNRYCSPTNQPLQGATNMEPQVSQPYVIDLDRIIGFKCNAKLTFNTYMLKVEPNNVSITENITVVDCLPEAVEGLIEDVNSHDSIKLLTVRSFVVTNSFYKTVSQTSVNELIKNNVTKMYKLLKSKYISSTTRYEINLYEALDKMLTDYINEYLIINTETGGKIDSFIEDFNDLIKALDKAGNGVDSLLIDYLNKILLRIHSNIELVHSANDNATESGDDLVSVPEEYTICYVDKLSRELGMNNVPFSITLINDCIPNIFLISCIKEVCRQANITSFVMSTIDKRIYMCYLGNNDNTYIKAIG